MNLKNKVKSILPKSMVENYGDMIAFSIVVGLILVILILLFGISEPAKARSEVELELGVYSSYSNFLYPDDMHVRANIVWNLGEQFGLIPISHMSQLKQDDDFSFDGAGIQWRLQFGRQLECGR